MDPVRSEQTDQPSPFQPPPAPESESVESATRDLPLTLDPGEPTNLVAVPVDPYVVHCQWNVAPGDIENARRALGVGENEYWPVLQFYDVTDTAQGETVRRPSISVDVQLEAENWYVRSCSPDHAYRADLALRREDGSIAVIASSERVETPPSQPSTYADEHWLPIRVAPWIPESPAAQHLPIDMRTEVQSKLAALYDEPPQEAHAPPTPSQFQSESQFPSGRSEDARGETVVLHHNAGLPANREAPTPDLSAQSSLPIDMREEVRELLSQLYGGVEGNPPTPAEGSLPTEELRIPHVVQAFHAMLPEIKGDVAADLTELDERSFTSGVSSRMK